MNYKEWLIPDLKQLEQKRSSLVNIPKKIRTLEDAFSALRAARTDSVHVMGGEGSAREEALIGNIAERDKLRRNLEIARADVQRIDSALATLSEDERRTLERFYIFPCPGHVERLCSELGYERSQIYKIKDRALEKMARTLYGIVEL